MTGFCGVVGPRPRDAAAIADGLIWSGREETDSYTDDSLSIHVAALPRGGPELAVSDGGARVWCWGNVFGRYTDVGADGKRRYERRADGAIGTAAYLADRYDECGTAFAEPLNGDFVAVVADGDEIHFVTDRWSTRECYYTVTDAGALCFSTRLQSLTRHPDVTPEYHRDYIVEYLVHGLTFGTTTPLVGIQSFPPGTVSTYNTSSKTFTFETYWRPHHRVVERTYEEAVDEFTGLFCDAVRDRTPQWKTLGVLLSGGSDSRLLLAAMDDEQRRRVTAYTATGWMNREAKTARRIAKRAGVHFTHLQRPLTFHADMIQRTPPLSNFVQRFYQAHLEYDIDRIADESDVVISNHLADTLVKGYWVPKHHVRSNKRFKLPIEKRIDSIEEYVDWLRKDDPPYLVGMRPLRDILLDNIVETDEGFVHHGVTFDSLEDMVLWGRMYPGRNGTDEFFRQSLHENVDHAIPMLDTRIVDFVLTLPTRHMVRGNLVDSAICKLAPELATIPHAETGVPPSYSFPLSLARRYAVSFKRSVLGLVPTPPHPYQSNGPWGDKVALVRRNPAYGERLAERRALAKAIPWLDEEELERIFAKHVAGENHVKPILAALTLLHIPVTAEIYGDRVEEEEKSEPAVVTAETAGHDDGRDTGSGAAPATADD